MSPQQGNIHALENAIMAEAKREARQILEEARAKAERMKREAQLELDAECRAIVQQAREQAETTQSHAASAAQLEAQNLKLQRREQLLASVFSNARQRLSEVTRQHDYSSIVQNLVKEAIQKLNAEELVIHADEAAQELLKGAALDALNKTTSTQLTLGEPLAAGTGVILETPNGHRRYDNTLETRMQRMQDSLRTEVYHVLRGESR